LDNLIDGMKTGEAFANKPRAGGRGRGVGAGGGGGTPGKPGAALAGDAVAMLTKLKSKAQK